MKRILLSVLFLVPAVVARPQEPKKPKPTLVTKAKQSFVELWANHKLAAFGTNAAAFVAGIALATAKDEKFTQGQADMRNSNPQSVQTTISADRVKNEFYATSALFGIIALGTDAVKATVKKDEDDEAQPFVANTVLNGAFATAGYFLVASLLKDKQQA